MRPSDLAAAIAAQLDGGDVAPVRATRSAGRAQIPVEDQAFADFDEWVDTASAKLTIHPNYNDTENGAYGFRGRHFKALCFDQLGRLCSVGRDFMQARDDCAFPVWYVWPDQIGELILSQGRDIQALRSDMFRLGAESAGRRGDGR